MKLLGGADFWCAPSRNEKEAESFGEQRIVGRSKQSDKGVCPLMSTFLFCVKFFCLNLIGGKYGWMSNVTRGIIGEKKDIMPLGTGVLRLNFPNFEANFPNFEAQLS